ncbi:hypothetical protein DFH07DRAFT_314021 [Mycena maculata]|uniref:Acetyl-coenzyme A synthetase N-terminal domain-containing protein n=1 Tax=Mycena maculata TaxID=230809 RepID=A0AAD7HG51_9AGAR|nr:hypothetical protein DFH07DRAFT_314021 [Mycena maculata]
MLTWIHPPTTVRAGAFATGDIAWFPDGTLNAYNCVDRHAVALIYEADEPGQGCSVTYAELLREVCGNVLRRMEGRYGARVPTDDVARRRRVPRVRAHRHDPLRRLRGLLRRVAVRRVAARPRERLPLARAHHVRRAAARRSRPRRSWTPR